MILIIYWGIHLGIPSESFKLYRSGIGQSEDIKIVKGIPLGNRTMIDKDNPIAGATYSFISLATFSRGSPTKVENQFINR